jgi:hypothetical protein
VFNNLQILGVSMHLIHAKGMGNPSRAEEKKHDISLKAAAKTELSNRLLDALGPGSDAIEMIRDVDMPDETIRCISSILEFSATENIKSQSLRIAELLADAQNSTNSPGGPIFIIKGTTSERNIPFVSIVKAEFTNALIHSEGDDDIDIVEKIFLTDKQTLYKVSFTYLINTELPLSELYTSENMNFLVYDYNTSYSAQNTRALYFYKVFMGLKYKETDAITTKNFYNHTKGFILSSTMDSDSKFNLVSNLYSYMTSPTRTVVNISRFARENLPEDIRTEYRREMVRRGIPIENFHLDISEITSSLGTRVVSFVDGQKVRIPSALILNENSVTFDEDTNTTTITIIGTPKEL